MHGGPLAAPFTRMDDAVELRQRTPAGIAAAWRQDGPALAERCKGARPDCPFVEVAQQHRRSLAAMHVRAHCLDLVHSAQARQVEVHADDVKRCPVDAQMRADRPARLEPGQFDRFGRGDLDSAAHEDGVAVPANAGCPRAQRSGAPAVLLERLSRNDRFPEAEAAIDFLQGDDIGADLAQHGEDALGVAAAVDTDSLVDVVAGECELHGRVRSPQSAGTVPGAPGM